MLKIAVPNKGSLADSSIAILKEAGYSFEQVVKCSIFIQDMNHFGQINGVYGQYFTANPPARETVEVARLPKNVRVEISCIAYK